MADLGAIHEIVAAVRAAADSQRAVREKRYLKSELTHFGTSVPAIRAVVTAFARRHPELARTELVALVQGLWTDPVHERRVAAVELLGLYGSLLGPAGPARAAAPR